MSTIGQDPFQQVDIMRETVKYGLHLIKNRIIKTFSSSHLTWNKVSTMPIIRLYAGDIPDLREYDGLIGLSLTRNDSRHLQHDLKKPFPLPDNSVDSFQAEDVFEHIGYDELVLIINEIFRILKNGSLFRLSLPDYGCDLLLERSIKDDRNNIIFDPGGGRDP